MQSRPAALFRKPAQAGHVIADAGERSDRASVHAPASGAGSPSSHGLGDGRFWNGKIFAEAERASIGSAKARNTDELKGQSARNERVLRAAPIAGTARRAGRRMETAPCRRVRGPASRPHAGSSDQADGPSRRWPPGAPQMRSSPRARPCRRDTIVRMSVSFTEPLALGERDCAAWNKAGSRDRGGNYVN